MLTPRQFLLTALLLGAALWVSRAVVDTTADGLRVAYLPSAPELLGLAVLGGLVIGIVRAFSDQWIGAQWQPAVLFGILILILVFRPSGLLGVHTREKV